MQEAADVQSESALRKDANEVLIKDGPEALRALIQAAQPYPEDDAAAATCYGQHIMVRS